MYVCLCVRYLLRFTIRHLIESDIAKYQEWHNTHHIDGIGRPKVMFAFPERLGKAFQGRPIDQDKLNLVKRRFPSPSHVWYPSQLAECFNLVLKGLGYNDVSAITKLNWQVVVLQMVEVLDHMDTDIYM
jgi:hypothetical protein